MSVKTTAQWPLLLELPPLQAPNLLAQEVALTHHQPLAFFTEDLSAPLEASWLKVLSAEFEQPYWRDLSAFLHAQLQTGKQILPPNAQWFNALNSTPLNQVKVVILGQDPYPTPGHAHGLCFSVQPGVKPLPKSLLNINKELLSDLGVDNRHNGCLQPWAQQGVLLINAVLTVEAGRTNSHQNQGWEQFTDAVMSAVNQHSPHCVFVLWGAYAQKKAALIDATKHTMIMSPHPSPLSAYRGFFGSKPFSAVNAALLTHGQTPIDWRLP